MKMVCQMVCQIRFRFVFLQAPLVACDHLSEATDQQKAGMLGSMLGMRGVGVGWKTSYIKCCSGHRIGAVLSYSHNGPAIDR